MRTLAIQNVVEVNVKFTLKDGRIHKPFAFSFTANRLDQDDITERLESKDKKIKDFMGEVITDWQGQRLVLEENGEPSPFSPDALLMLLNVAGVASVCFNAYFKECGAKEKN